MKSLIIFASGQGSNAKAIIEHFKTFGNVTVSLIVCNNPQAGVIGMAREENIPLRIIDRSGLNSTDFVTELQSHHPDLIVLAGFLKKIPEKMIQAFPQKIINLHPALLPKYGGKGMFGKHVHEAVKAAGEIESGITIHWVNEHYDEGAIILQTHCPVLPADSPEDIAERIHHLEHFFLPRAIEFLLSESTK